MAQKQNVVKVFIIFTLFTDDITNAVIIENMYVPEVVQSGSTDIILGCQFSVPVNNYSVHWLFNGNEVNSNRSSPKSAIITDPLIIRSREKQSTLNFQQVKPSMSGNYTCQLTGVNVKVRQTKHMFVFGPEKDFTLKIKYPNIKHRSVDVQCIASGLYPKPEINLQLDNRPVPKQVQRVWWKEDSYTAEGSAELLDVAEGKHEVTCRLHLPQADYTVIMKKLVYVGSKMCCDSNLAASSNFVMIATVCIWVAFLY